jgi:hypothetical protein
MLEAALGVTMRSRTGLVRVEPELQDVSGATQTTFSV